MGIDANGFARFLSLQEHGKKNRETEKQTHKVLEDDSYGFDYDEIIRYTYANIESVTQLYQHFGMDLNAKGKRSEHFDEEWQVFNSHESGKKGQNVWKKLCKNFNIPEESALYGMTQNTIQEEYKNVLFNINGEYHLRLVLKSVLRNTEMSGLTSLDLAKWGIEYNPRSATYASLTGWSTVIHRNIPLFVNAEQTVPLLLVRGERGHVVRLR